MLVPTSLVKVCGTLALVDAVQAGAVRIEYADHSTRIVTKQDCQRVRSNKLRALFWNARREAEKRVAYNRLPLANVVNQSVCRTTPGVVRVRGYLFVDTRAAIRFLNLSDCYKRAPLMRGISTMSSIGRSKHLRCTHPGCSKVRPYWSRFCKAHREAKLAVVECRRIVKELETELTAKG